MKIFFYVFLISWHFSPNGYLFAHEINRTKAKITLCDGQVELQLSINLEAWEERHLDDKAWLMGDIEEAISSEISSEETRTILLNQTHLQVGGLSVPLKL